LAFKRDADETFRSFGTLKGKEDISALLIQHFEALLSEYFPLKKNLECSYNQETCFKVQKRNESNNQEYESFFFLNAKYFDCTIYIYSICMFKIIIICMFKIIIIIIMHKYMYV
jgi:hypothetical protein